LHEQSTLGGIHKIIRDQKRSHLSPFGVFFQTNFEKARLQKVLK